MTDPDLRQRMITDYNNQATTLNGNNRSQTGTNGAQFPDETSPSGYMDETPGQTMQNPGPSQPGLPVLPTGGDLLISPERTPTSPGEGFANDIAGVKPFGWQLFSSGVAVSREQSINPTYIINPGDKIAVQIWGPAMTPDSTGGSVAQPVGQVVTVDLQGNIFLPELGPIRVAGLNNGALNQRVSAAYERIFTTNVKVYTNLLNSQPVGVYVTGAVVHPGRYAGDRTDSVLYFLGQAGGVDLQRGSFRDITVLRGGKLIATIDLYAFLLNGVMPNLEFQDNDTVVVGGQKPTVTVAGNVHNVYQFEIGRPTVTGADVVAMAQPLPKVTHVALHGFRDGQPFENYLTLDEFRQAKVQDGDSMLFQSDLVDGTIFVTVTGQSSGPSSFAVPRGTRLKQFLDMVPIDPRTTDISSIYLRRKSVAERQQRALELSLDQLQRAVLTAESSTPSEAQIRGPEAEMIMQFIERARSVQPEGRVVLAGQNGIMDVQLEADDAIVIPLKSDIVLVSGEVEIPQNLVYEPGKPASYYIGGSGGPTQRADTSHLLVARQNGMIVSGSNPKIEPGDHIMVMPEVDTKDFAVLTDIVQVLYRVAISTGVVLAIL